MKQYIIDGNNFTGVETFYDEVAKVFSFPEYFGRNLDALYDSLSDIGEPMEIVWKNSQKSKIEFSSDASQPTFFAQVMYTLGEVYELKVTLE
ncbi:MAG: barstar family protein [Candidatus Gracilibacteria bacterium]|nr:barstar family protein [Candidatus Gracilibacteria bacterium]